jgi:hypothetical protein
MEEKTVGKEGRTRSLKKRTLAAFIYTRKKARGRIRES